MIQNTKYTVPLEVIEGVMGDVYEIGKFNISEQTGSFFYDPWQLKPEYLGTQWESIWNSLPEPKGQARIIILESPSCYTSHADIDNRWHLNLCGDEAYLIEKVKEHNLNYAAIHVCNTAMMEEVKRKNKGRTVIEVSANTLLVLHRY